MKYTIETDTPYKGDIIIKSDNLYYAETAEPFEGSGMQCAVSEDSKEYHYDYINTMCENLAKLIKEIERFNVDIPIKDILIHNEKTEIRQ